MEFISAYLPQNVTLGNIFTNINSIDQTTLPTTTTTTRVVLIPPPPPPRPRPAKCLSRYENQKRRDWNTFCQYLNSHRPPLSISICNTSHVLEFLKFLDQFGKTKVHFQNCPFFGMPNPPAPCSCPLRQAWGSLDSLIGRLRAAYEEHVGGGEGNNNNPFGGRSVRIFLRDVRDFQSKSRGINYQKKKRKRPSSSNNNKQHKIAIISRTTN